MKHLFLVKLVLPHTYNSYRGLPGRDGHPGKRHKTKVETMELYNLSRDPGEQYNVVEAYPEKVKEIMLVVEQYKKELGDLNVGISQGEENRPIRTLEKVVSK